MEFQTVSHACLAVREGGKELLVDPWLIGSCYWRSWFNFPEPSLELLESLKPDYIYLTHLHWDHFHGPSLRRFPRQTTVFVPKVPATRRMVEDLNWLGFHNVIELAHGVPHTLEGGLTITSFQAGMGVDSTLVIDNGKTTIVNANDCKTFGHSLAQITKRYPDIDFVLRSHSSATPVPYCIDDYPQRFSDVRSPQDYAEEFSRFALTLNARYAVPFASNHCYLHKDTKRFNALATDPQTVFDFANREAQKRGARTQTVLMPSGSRWSEETGFDLTVFDYANRDAYIAALEEKYRDKLEQCYAEEAQTELDEGAAQTYFTGLFAALPPRALSGKALDFQIIFELQGKDTRRLQLDFAQRKLTFDPPANENAIVIRTPTRVFNDCCQLKMFSTWSASKRVGFSVPPHMDLSTLNRFLLLSDFYELGQLPLQHNLTLRSLDQRLRRFREVIDFGAYAWQAKTQKGFRISDLYPLPEA